MAIDNTVDLFQKSINQQIEKMKNDGLSDHVIIEKLNSCDFASIFVDISKKMAEDVVDYMEIKMYENVMEQRAITAEFLARQEQKWGKCFVASEAMYYVVLEIVENYVNYIAEETNEFEKEEIKYTFYAIREIHGRACQQYLEILHLNRLGFADGAYARWRSMYELSVVADFISKHGEVVAKAFIDSAVTNDRYDWAKTAECFKTSNKRHITFNDLQTSCDFATDDWKKQYDLANKVVHASSQGTFNRLGKKDAQRITLVGHSDFGITTAAEHSAISLLIITNMFLCLYPYGDGAVAMQCIYEWINIIRKSYFKTKEEVFKD